ncbi:FadR/GntR family transcriptional regulator [Streptomyces sp. NPDC050625]|uniref:FadR/GntR family transcriptional regulator n=1 Tax=Streptomyces sp. NPDC050625 TaxID=3154629 RepID=UPI00343CB8BD
MSPSIERPRKQSEIVARAITAQIISEELPEGTRLPNESTMLESFQVGRSTLREALRLLESRGVLTIRSGRDGGPIVRNPKASDLGEALTLLLQFKKVSFSEVFHAREILEPLLARLAAEHMTPEILDKLDASIERMAANLSNREIFREETLNFHDLIASAAQSAILELIVGALESVAGGLAYGAVPANFTDEMRSEALAAHERIAAALRSGSLDDAEKAMADHLAVGGESWRKVYDDLSRMPVQWASIDARFTK